MIAAPFEPVKPVVQRRFAGLMTTSASSPASATAWAMWSALLTGALQCAREELERVAVAVTPAARYTSDTEVGNDRVAPPLLARFDVREVNLDRRQAHELERVPDRVRVVRPRARIQHKRIGGVGGRVQRLAELALVVGLIEDH